MDTMFVGRIWPTDDKFRPKQRYQKNCIVGHRSSHQALASAAESCLTLKMKWCIDWKGAQLILPRAAKVEILLSRENYSVIPAFVQT